MIVALLDAVIFDIGGTIVNESAPETPVEHLVPMLLPKVAADLEYLSGLVRIGAATNTSVMTEPDVRRLLDVVGINRYFDVLVTSCDVGASKPDPTSLIVAMERLGLVEPGRILYIGDRDIDEMAAHAAGFQFAYISNDGLRASVSEWVDQWLSLRDATVDDLV
ncbi:MAG TPA: HAD-IA family hydrolase [Acidimicrobiales bacterium]|nr:HAD-IA family hydrolase [Acidimicrobiales bacterium]